MVINSTQLDLTFGALADSTRRGILLQLSSGEKNVSTLVDAYQISQPAISKHLRVLEKAGLVERRKDGRQQIVSLVTDGAEQAATWIQHYTEHWKTQFDAVEEYINAKKREKGKS